MVDANIAVLWATKHGTKGHGRPARIVLTSRPRRPCPLPKTPS